MNFKVAVISDEISQDLDHACFVISKEFEVQWIELRSVWGTNVLNFDEVDLVKTETILARYGLQVTNIASPLFKVDWPDAPRSRFSPDTDLFDATFDFDQQRDVLERSIALAKRFKTTRVRCFGFRRLDDVKPYRAAINAKLQEAAEISSRQGIPLILENEFACNTATGREVAETLAAIHSPSFILNWDPGNTVMARELDAFPITWNWLPKKRIGYCHCKNATRENPGEIHWAPPRVGYID